MPCPTHGADCDGNIIMATMSWNGATTILIISPFVHIDS